MRACSHCRKVLPAAEAVCPDDGSPGAEVGFDAVPAELAARVRAPVPFAYGATGQLFTALHPQSEQRLLLKVFADSVSASLAERTRCKRELRKQSLIVHSQLPHVLDEGEVAGHLWVLREFAVGETLAVRLRRQGPLPVPEALAVAAQVASALDELHRQGLVHRDVKPGHVVLTARAVGPARVCLIDAGMAARLPGDAMFESFGTAAYAAPEIAAGRPASFRSDLYSLGCMLYEMLSGAPPFAGATVQAVLAAQRELEPKPLDIDLPAPVRALLDTLLAKEPRRRPFSAQQVRRALDPHLPAGMPESESSTRSVAPSAAAPKPPAPSGRSSAKRSPPAAPRNAESTHEIALDELELTDEPSTNTEELDLADMEPLPPLAPRTQELELADIVSLPPLSPKTQELDLADIEPLSARRVEAAKRASYRAVEPEDSNPTVALRSDPPSPAAPAAATAGQPSVSASARPPVPDFDVEALFGDSPEPVDLPAASDLPASTDALLTAVANDASVSGSRPSQSGSVAELRVDDAASALAASDSALESEAPLLGAVSTEPPAARRRPWPFLSAAALLLALAIGFKLSSRRGPAPDVSRQTQAPAGTHVATAPEVSPEPIVAPPPPAAAEAVPSAVEAPSPAPPPPSAAEAPPSAPVAAAAPSVAAASPPDAPVPAAQNPDAGPAAPVVQTLSAAEAGKAFLRDAGPSELGGIVPYKPRARVEVDYKGKARQLYQTGKFRDAADAYERAAQKAPSDSAAYAGLGASWLSAGEPDRAIVAYQRAVQLKPEVSGFQAALGRAYLSKGDRARAAAAYAKALALDPQNQAAKTALATLRP